MAKSLIPIIYILDPDVIIFGGGLSNEINFLDEVKNIIKKNIKINNLKTKFLKPKYGDSSGVRGAAMLGKKSIY